MNYTVRLSHGQPFMAGVFDSAGNSFAFGPLHAGQSTDVLCFGVASGTGTSGHGSGISGGAFAGDVIGAFIVGAFGAILFGWLYTRRQEKHEKTSVRLPGNVISKVC